MWGRKRPCSIMVCSTPEAYKLLHDGVCTLSKVECNGIHIDMDYLHRAKARIKKKLASIREELMSDTEFMPTWRRRYGNEFNLDSATQLGEVLSSKGIHLDLTESAKAGNTKGTTFRTDAASLTQLDHPFVALYLELRKFNKLLSTFLEGIERETVDGVLRVFFHLHKTKTFRSSSSDINFQNLPIRDPIMGEVIRRCFIPRGPDRHIVEIDYSGIEVCIAACYHKDPNMISYIHDETKDMHRDMAAQCYCTKPEQVSKGMRYCGKNMFVFPEFYGSYFMECGLNLWQAIHKSNLTTVDGTPVLDCLRKKGITELGDYESDWNRTEKGTGKISTKAGTFLEHIRQVEDDFWNRRFQVYGQWRKSWFKKYQRNGYIKTHTGFVLHGPMRRNEVINYPVQGAAFHCLLWSLIRIQKELEKRGMRSLIIGQIHDSIVADVPSHELDQYLAIAKYVMTVLLPKKWKWIIVNLSVEAEVAPAGQSWFKKKAVAV